ncbi:MAG: SIMPL domain-containing protein, partial [Phenylobacterium sp.]|nr:SIMPL domain-containing protein [Phenylobacterium sp.]
MKRIGLLLLLLAGCTQPPDPRGVRPDEVLLQVAATGRAEARPDEARLTVGVSTNAPAASAASAGNNAAMARVSAALARLGVKPDDIQTRS